MLNARRQRLWNYSHCLKEETKAPHCQFSFQIFSNYDITYLWDTDLLSKSHFNFTSNVWILILCLSWGHDPHSLQSLVQRQYVLAYCLYMHTLFAYTICPFLARGLWVSRCVFMCTLFLHPCRICVYFVCACVLLCLLIDCMCNLWVWSICQFVFSLACWPGSGRRWPETVWRNAEVARIWPPAYLSFLKPSHFPHTWNSLFFFFTLEDLYFFLCLFV